MTHSKQEATSELNEDNTLPMGVPTFDSAEVHEARRHREHRTEALERAEQERSGERPEGAWVRSATSPPAGSGARRTGLGPRARQFRPMRLAFEDVTRKRARKSSNEDDHSWY